MTKSETQLTLQKRVHHLLKMMRSHFDNEHPDPDQTEPCQYLDDVEEEILALFQQALTSLKDKHRASLRQAKCSHGHRIKL